MSAAPKHHRAVRTGIPRLPLPAILVFAVVGLGGSLFLTYTNSFTSAADSIRPVASPTDNAPVYSARAVPLDFEPRGAAARAIARAQAAISTVPELRQTETETETETNELVSDSRSSEPVLFTEASRELKGFNRFSNFSAANSFVSSTATTFGMIAQTDAPAYVASDGDVITAPVPESSTWLCAAALLALVATRGLHASWHRNQRRTANKTNSPQP